MSRPTKSHLIWMARRMTPDEAPLFVEIDFLNSEVKTLTTQNEELRQSRDEYKKQHRMAQTDANALRLEAQSFKGYNENWRGSHFYLQQELNIIRPQLDAMTKERDNLLTLRTTYGEVCLERAHWRERHAMLRETLNDIRSIDCVGGDRARRFADEALLYDGKHGKDSKLDTGSGGA